MKQYVKIIEICHEGNNKLFLYVSILNTPYYTISSPDNHLIPSQKITPEASYNRHSIYNSMQQPHRIYLKAGYFFLYFYIFTVLDHNYMQLPLKLYQRYKPAF